VCVQVGPAEATTVAVEAGVATVCLDRLDLKDSASLR
jgi:hypothetical protein